MDQKNDEELYKQPKRININPKNSVITQKNNIRQVNIPEKLLGFNIHQTIKNMTFSDQKEVTKFITSECPQKHFKFETNVGNKRPQVMFFNSDAQIVQPLNQYKVVPDFIKSLDINEICILQLK